MTRILLVDDDSDFSAAMQAMLEAEGHTVHTSSCVEEAKAQLARNSIELLFVDLSLPDGSGLELVQDDGPRAVVITGHPSVKSAVRAIRGRVVDYLVKPVDKDQLLKYLPGDAKRSPVSGKSAVEYGDIRFVGESPAVKKMLGLVADFGPTEESMLILGESGTGKDLIARLIHEMRESEGAFVPINCGAIPRELIASELFGHEKGSFTGATGKRKGVFERANRGTVFLDEVGELPPDHQIALLRVLESRTIIPVGGEQEVPINTKVIAATNQDLEKQVSEGAFREDLYFRLMVLPVHIPPLRERAGDVEVLARHFLKKYAQTHGAPTRIEDDVLDALNQYRWPGNVRELKHTMLRMAIMNRGKDSIDCLPEDFGHGIDLKADASRLQPGMSIKDMERSLIQKTLEHFDGNKTQTAEALGISLKTLYNRLSEYGEDVSS